MSVETLKRPEYSLNPQQVGIDVPKVFIEAFNPQTTTADSADNYSREVRASQPEIFTPINPQKLMQDVRRLRQFYYRSLGMEDEINKVRNFDPPLVRAMLEQLKTPEEQKLFIAQQAEENIPTALGERYSVVESVAKYTLNPDGKLYSESFSNEPFEEVIKRGVQHAKNLGTPDADREDAQLRGFLNVQESAADLKAPKGVKMAFISGPRFQEGTNTLIPGTNFYKNFVDIYEFLGEDPITKIRRLQMIRYTSSATYEHYEDKVKQYKPDYFDQADGRVDNFYAENGIKIDPGVDKRSPTEIFIQLTGAVKGVLSRDNLQQIIEGSKARVSYFIEAIRASTFDPHEVALSWNAILAGADRKRDELLGITQRIVRGIVNQIKTTPVFRTIIEEVNWLGRQVIEKVMAACGMSGGFSLGKFGKGIKGLFSGVESTIGSILGFSGEDQYGSLEFECPKCNRTNRRPKGELIPNCQHCNADVIC